MQNKRFTSWVKTVFTKKECNENSSKNFNMKNNFPNDESESQDFDENKKTQLNKIVMNKGTDNIVVKRKEF